MDKAQAIQAFWEGFGLTAYDEATVPTAENAPPFPYITYSVVTDSIGNTVNLSGDIWYRSYSWQEVTKKANEIAEYIGYGHRVMKIDGGYVWIVKGTPFAQRMGDDSDDQIRRIHINLQAEFLTAY